MKQLLIKFVIAYILSFITWIILVNLIVGIIGLGSSFLNWDISHLYSTFDGLYETARDIREGILIIGIVSCIPSLIGVGIWMDDI